MMNTDSKNKTVLKTDQTQQLDEISAPVFSVIMNCYNCEEFLQEALDSVYSQDFNDFEIIFFDNASSDASPKIAQSCDRRLRYVHNPTLISLGAARNLAIKYAKGEFIAFLDCDDVWEPSKLHLQYQALKAGVNNRTYGFCYTDAMRMRADGENILSYSAERSLGKGEVLAELMMDCFIAMSSCVIRRDVLIEFGGFNEMYDQVEEWDLWLRVASQYDLAFVPSCETRIRFHGNNTSKNYKKQQIEIEHLLSHLSVDSKFENSRNYAQNWFKVRFAFTDIMHKMNEKKYLTIFSLFYYLLKHPVISIRIMRVYLNPALLGFFYAKYFQNRI